MKLASNTRKWIYFIGAAVILAMILGSVVVGVFLRQKAPHKPTYASAYSNLQLGESQSEASKVSLFKQDKILSHITGS